MRVWDNLITERDRLVYKGAEMGETIPPGRKPAVLIVDVTKAFIGDKPEPILQSIRRFPASSGEEGWKAVEKIKELLSVARSAKVPVFYSAVLKVGRKVSVLSPESASSEDPDLGNAKGIPSEITPQDGDVVIEKLKPSPFFGTPLVSYLVKLGVDTLIVTGGTTSGCVRAAVIDAYSYNYRVLVVEECTFDRGQASHAINLFDMNQKYANVVTLEEVKKYILSLSTQK